MAKSVILQDIYDKEGNLKEIEVIEPSGNVAFVAIWDINDEQTHDNRVAFREWTKTMAKRKGYDV